MPLSAPFPVSTGMLGLSPSAAELPKTLGSPQVSKHPQLTTPLLTSVGSW